MKNEISRFFCIRPESNKLEGLEPLSMEINILSDAIIEGQTTMMPLVPSTAHLRNVQKKLLKTMLNFNSTVGSEAAILENDDWKILILDSMGKTILSPVLKVNELREAGVTLYLQLHADRQPISDVPAVYFVEPTAQNINRICEDLSNGLYEQIYLNFTSSIPRLLLEDLAQQVAQSDTSHLITKVFDQYMSYECLEKNLFTLSMPDTFVTLSSAQTEAEIDGVLDKVTAGLFSVCLTMGGQCPIICASKGTAAEMVGSKLERKLRSHMTNIQSNLIGESNMNEASRPRTIRLN